MPICNISKFDYFHHIDYLLEYTKVLVGSDLLTSVLQKLSALTCYNYKNNKTCTINIMCRDMEMCKTLFSILSQYNLEEEYNNKHFYSTIAQLAMIAGGLGAEFFYTQTYLEYEENPVLFVPIINEEKNTITIKIPNKHLLYVRLIPSISTRISPYITSAIAYKAAYAALAEMMTKHKSFIFYPELIEQEEISGVKFGIFTLYNDNIYMISDMSFSIGNTIEKIVENLYQNSHIDKIDKYISDHNQEWQEYKNMKLSTNYKL